MSGRRKRRAKTQRVKEYKRWLRQQPEALQNGHIRGLYHAGCVALLWKDRR